MGLEWVGAGSVARFRFRLVSAGFGCSVGLLGLLGFGLEWVGFGMGWVAWTLVSVARFRLFIYTTWRDLIQNVIII